MDIKKAKVHVIGSYAVGMTMKTDSFPEPGETVAGHSFIQLHGGKGSNQAVCSARLGAEVLFTTCIGQDNLGSSAALMLENEGVKTEGIYKTASSNTGVGFVMVGSTGENEILIDLGANEYLSTTDIEKSFSLDFNPDVILVQLEANLDAVFHALKLAKERNIPAILNPAPFRSIPDEFVKLATYLTPNNTEAAGLLGFDGTPEALCKALYDRYGTKVVMTGGEHGAYILDSNHEVVNIPGERVEVIDTTGAGDCFNATLAVKLGEGCDLLESVKMANIAASMSVQVDGVIESLPYKSALELKLK